MKTLARRVKTSPRITEYGSVRLTKKGWNAVSPTLGATPNPTEETQNAPAAHFVMVSGTVFSRSVEPPSLQKNSLNRFQLKKKPKKGAESGSIFYPTETRSQIHVSGKNVLTVSFFWSSFFITPSEFIVLKARGTGESTISARKQQIGFNESTWDGNEALVAEQEATFKKFDHVLVEPLPAVVGLLHVGVGQNFDPDFLEKIPSSETDVPLSDESTWTFRYLKDAVDVVLLIRRFVEE